MELQARCPQGVGLVTSLVNTPDFFARAKAWPGHQVFAAYHDGRLAGAASCAWRRALLAGQEKPLGYEFEYFVAPEFRRQGVARALHMSRRTLQRRLDEEGTSYKATLDSLRRELCLQYLERPEIALAEIAHIGGFSDTSALTRAVRRWTGQTPLEYRRSHSNSSE